MTCSKELDPSWNVCPFCGTRISVRHRTTTSTPDLQATWSTWRLYTRHLSIDLLPIIREFAMLVEHDGEVADIVEAAQPSRLLGMLGKAMRRLGELAAQPAIPIPVRAAMLDVANQNHEAMATERLAPATAEFHAAVQAFIDAGQLAPGFVDRIMQYVERRGNAENFADVATAVTGIDSGVARMVGFVVAGLLEKSRTDARMQRLGSAYRTMLMTCFEIMLGAWDIVARKCADQGLVLCNAAELQEVESRAQALQERLVAHQKSREGEFEQVLSLVHALVRQHPHSPSVSSVLTHGELLAEVRAQLLGSWTTRHSIGMDAADRTRAERKFLRMYPGDSVIAFFATTILGSGKAGLVFTTASVQWLIDEATPQRYGYAQLKPEQVGWAGSVLHIGDHEIGLTDLDADAAGRLLQAVLRLLAVRPGPPECICGAPVHWLLFGSDAAHCRACKVSVDYI